MPNTEDFTEKIIANETNAKKLKLDELKQNFDCDIDETTKHISLRQYKGRHMQYGILVPLECE